LFGGTKESDEKQHFEGTQSDGRHWTRDPRLRITGTQRVAVEVKTAYSRYVRPVARQVILRGLRLNL
jgi:hypothetical protein